MNILYIALIEGNRTSKFTLNSLKRIYKKVDCINTNKILPFHNFSYKLFFHLSPKLFEKHLDYFFYQKIKKKYDLVFINNSEFITDNTLDHLKKNTRRTLFYCSDNPFVNRDKKRFFFLIEIQKNMTLLFFR